MPFLSEANLRTAIGLRIKMSNEALKFASSSSPNYVTMEDTYLLALGSDAMPEAASAAGATRRTLAQLLDPSVLRRDLRPLWLEYSRIKGWAETDDVAIIVRLFETFALTGTPVTVKNRAWTYSAVSDVGSPVGSGDVYRCVTDRFAYQVEGQLFAETKSIRCIGDENSGRPRHQERFLIRGEAFGRDVLDIGGTGVSAIVDVLSSEGATAQLVSNPSFEQVVESGGSLTSLSGWEVTGSLSNLASVDDDGTGNTIFQDVPGASTSRSLQFSTNESIYQRLKDRRWTWNPDVPLFASVALRRQSSCDGTFTLTIGGSSSSVVLAAQSGWFLLNFPVNENAWFRQWNDDAGQIKLALASRTTGTLLVDSLVVGPYTNVAGVNYAIRGGATPFRVDDEFSTNDTCSETGIIQKWLARTYGLYLPHTSGSAVWVDP